MNKHTHIHTKKTQNNQWSGDAPSAGDKYSKTSINIVPQRRMSWYKTKKDSSHASFSAFVRVPSLKLM
jgi:hypothetical protein